MTPIPTDCKYTKEHEWVKADGSTKARVGITDYAQTELGDVVFVDLPAVGKTVKRGESVASVESVKAVSDIYAPADGKVIEVNSSLTDKPQLLNEDPHSSGWIIVMELSNPSQLGELLPSEAYGGYLAEISK